MHIREAKEEGQYLMTTSKTLVPAMLAVTVSFLICPDAAAVTLYGLFPSSTSDLYTIDTASMTADRVGSDSRRPRSPEIELDPSGTTLYVSPRGDFGPNLYAVNPNTGLNTGTISLTFPSGPYDTITAMEFVGSTLYAGITEAGPAVNSALATVNIATGGITLIGDTGLDPPLGGLAYDVGTSTMFGVTSTGVISQLVTIDLTTGVGTPVGDVTLGGTGLDVISGLEFGTDGVLYAVQARSPSTISLYRHLLRIDPATGAATDLGDMGVYVNSITAEVIPEPATLAAVLVAVTGAGGYLQKRRRRPSRLGSRWPKGGVRWSGQTKPKLSVV